MPKSTAERTRDNVRKYRAAGLIQAKIWVHPAEAPTVRAYAAKQTLTGGIRSCLKEGKSQAKTAGRREYEAHMPNTRTPPGGPRDAWKTLDGMSKRAWERRAAKCAARLARFSGQMVCDRCDLVWEMDDPSPPGCPLGGDRK